MRLWGRGGIRHKIIMNILPVPKKTPTEFLSLLPISPNELSAIETRGGEEMRHVFNPFNWKLHHEPPLPQKQQPQPVLEIEKQP